MAMENRWKHVCVFPGTPRSWHCGGATTEQFDADYLEELVRACDFIGYWAHLQAAGLYIPPVINFVPLLYGDA
jgi:hypothetical protein